MSSLVVTLNCAECRNSMKEKYVGLVGESAEVSIAGAEEKGDDVASLVATAAPQVTCQGNINQ